MTKSFYTTKQTADKLGISKRTLERWRSNGTFVPVVRTEGNHSRYSAEQIWEKLNQKPITDINMLF